MKKLLDSDFSLSKKKGVKTGQLQQQSQDVIDAIDTTFESIMATPREDKGLWLASAIRTLKEERKAMQESGIQPEASVTPEEDDGMDYDGSFIRGPEPSMKLPTTQYHKNIKFQPYKSTRPDLLVKLERFIQQHLHETPLKDAFKREGAESPELLEAKTKHSSPKTKTKKEKDPTSTVTMTKNLINNSLNLSQHNPWKQTSLQNSIQSIQDICLHPHPDRTMEQCLERKQVYAEAFQEYINDCTIYKPILQEAKDAYEEYIERLEQRIEELAGHAAAVSDKETHLQQQIEDIRNEQQQRVDAVQEQLRLNQQRIQTVEKEKRQLEAETNRQREIAAQTRKEYEEMRTSCNTLTSSLSRLEEEHRIYQNLEAGRLSEINHLRSSEQKLNEEIERLQQVIQSMEQAQANMVHQEVIINMEMTMDTLKAEVKRMEATHRQLLIRYATMKNVLDESFKQWQVGFLAAGGSTIVQDGNSAFYDERTRQQVTDIIHNSMTPKDMGKGKFKVSPLKNNGQQPRSRDISQQHPMEKLMFMIEKGANIKIVLETLIDHLAITTGGNLTGAGPGGSGPGGVMMRNGGNGGAVVAYLGAVTAGNGPYLDQYEATSFDMMNNALVPGNTGNRTYTYDNAKGEEIFITNVQDTNAPTSNPAGGSIVSFAEEFKSPWHHFEGLGYGDHVPIFLRFHGKIQNLFFSKLEIIRILNDVWTAKSQYDSYIQQFGHDFETAVVQAVAHISENNMSNSTILNEETSATNPINTMASGSRSNVTSAVAANNPRSKTNNNNNNNNNLTSGSITPTGQSSTAALLPATAGAPATQASRVGSASGTRANTANTKAAGVAGNNHLVLSVPALPFYANLPLHMNMATFLHHYLQDKFKHPAIVMEMGYNIVDSVKRFAHVSDCRLFAAVLEERLPMDAWDDQRDMLERVRDEVRKELKMLQSNSSLAVMAATAARNMMVETDGSGLSGSSSKRHSVTGSGNGVSSTGSTNNNNNNNNAVTTAALIDAQTKLTADNLMRVLKRCLPTKADISFVKLAKALSFDSQSGRYIDPDVVLYDDAQGNRPNFLEQLKLQHVTELTTFHKHVFDAIGTFHDVEDKEMTVGKLREALVYADPNKPRAEVNKLLAKACNCTVEETLLLEAKRTPLLIEDILRRLRRCLLVKSPPQVGHKK